MAIQVGQIAPDFKGQAVLPDGNFKEISLANYKGKWVVLFFYPLDFTFVCPTEIKGFNERADEFAKLKTQVIGASIDSVYCHKAWIDNGLGKLKFPLLSDITKEISRAYNVLIEDKGIALRGTFIIDPDGVISSSVVNITNVGRSVEETIRTLTAIQTGERTPCDWKPGDKTLGK